MPAVFRERFEAACPPPVPTPARGSAVLPVSQILEKGWSQRPLLCLLHVPFHVIPISLRHCTSSWWLPYISARVLLAFRNNERFLSFLN